MPSPILTSLPTSSSPSKSRSLFNFFALKFKPTSSPIPRAAPAKERRDAALRERGLLPPLKQNKDLSRQERDHDRQLPVVQHTAVTLDSPTTVTAASLIKKEWEARNNPVNVGSQIPEQDAEIPRLTGGQEPQGDDALGQPSPTWHTETGLVPSGHTILHPLPSAPADTTAEHGPGETTPIPITPIISLSPVAEELDVHQRKPSVSVSESQTSLATPSLDASSLSTGISLLGTAENSLRIKTAIPSGARKIPIIVESPIEEGPLPEMSIAGATPNLVAQQEQHQDIQTRRKKRSSRRLTVSASLTNMRRSVANTLSRTKSNLRAPKQGNTFDASYLPPSPTYPFSSLTRVDGRRSLDASATRLRQPVSPTLHNRASILLETSAIEDEETRRMTEVAFLD